VSNLKKEVVVLEIIVKDEQNAARKAADEAERARLKAISFCQYDKSMLLTYGISSKIIDLLPK
jgi:hypothetical protein